MLASLATTMDTEINLGSQYSEIIDPEDYNRIISKEHLYIAASDNFIKNTIRRKTAKMQTAEVVELGCGPGRLLPLMAKLTDIRLTTVDLDPEFLAYAAKQAAQLSMSVNIVQSDVTSYQHDKPVDIFYSQGMHHHIEKGQPTRQYLQGVCNQLKQGGYYIISDEFLPEYLNEADREIKAIIWYAHVIEHAITHNFVYLAQEEAKTLIDDLFEGHPEIACYKTKAQLDLVLNAVKQINSAAINKDFETAEKLAKQLFDQLTQTQSAQASGDKTMDLSRQDYKICDRIFQKEIENSAFVISEQKFFGLSDKIGGMIVYILKKL